MSANNTTRRNFLRTALSLMVVSTATPGLILGRVVPELTESAMGRIMASYTLMIQDFPELQLLGGSVKLVDFEQLALNPDHQQHGDADLRALDERRGWYPLAVTRVALDGVDAFKTVSTYCTHGQGYQVKDYDPNTMEFVCPHKGSSFRADGTRIDKPETPVVGDLRAFPTIFQPEQSVVVISGIAATSRVKAFDGVPGRLFMDQNYPNPFNPTTMIRFGLPSSSRVKLTIHTLLGNTVKTVVDETKDAGVHYIDVSASDLPSGAYFYRLQTELGTLTRRMVVSK